MIQKNLQELSKLIYDFSGVVLFAEMPSEELRSLDVAVTNEDSLRARVADLCNLIDRINKKELDLYIGIVTKGSRECFVNTLKKLLPREHTMINEQIDSPLGMILLLRGFLTHRKNRSINKALEYFQINHPIENFKEVWEKVLFHFDEILDHVIDALSSNSITTDHKQTEIDESLMLLLKERMINRFGSLLSEENIKSLLLYIMTEREVVDKEVADLFRLDLSEFRKLLFPLIPNILTVSYHNSESTKIRIYKYEFEILHEFYFEDKTE